MLKNTQECQHAEKACKRLDFRRRFCRDGWIRFGKSTGLRLILKDITCSMACDNNIRQFWGVYRTFRELLSE